MLQRICFILNMLPWNQYSFQMLNIHCGLHCRPLLFFQVLLVVASHHWLPCSSVVQCGTGCILFWVVPLPSISWSLSTGRRKLSQMCLYISIGVYPTKIPSNSKLVSKSLSKQVWITLIVLRLCSLYLSYSLRAALCLDLSMLVFSVNTTGSARDTTSAVIFRFNLHCAWVHIIYDNPWSPASVILHL